MTNNQQEHPNRSSFVVRRSSASAPGKIILCGEHAVVYGRPAIALPLHDVRAHVSIEPAKTADGFSFSAPNLGRTWLLDAKPDDPLSLLALETLAALGIEKAPPLHVTITSAVPIASGMGSGAAVATAMVRALGNYLGAELSNEQISYLVFQNERRLHGTPSGIDNTVVAFERPVWFERVEGTGNREQETRRQGDKETRRQGDRGANDIHPSSLILHPLPAPPSTVHRPSSTIQFLPITTPFTLLIADTGVRSATKLPVGDLRRRWQAEPTHYEALFDQIGEIAHAVRAALATGNTAALGPLLDQNHTLLQSLGVSSPELDGLMRAAKNAGAWGAKLSGAGWGGVMLALVAHETHERVATALLAAGATHTIATTVSASPV